MPKAKRHLYLGVGVVAALTCGLAPAPALALAPTPAAVAASTVVSGAEMLQVNAPRLAPGQSATIRMKVTNTSAKNGRGGSTFKLVAPTGTTFANANADISIVRAGYATTWAGTLSNGNRTLVFTRPAFELNAGDHVLIDFTIRADVDSTLTGTVGGGYFQVTAGTSLPIMATGIGYLAVAAAEVSQKSLPVLTQGATGSAIMTVANNVARGSTAGSTFVATAPSGTSFAGSAVSVRVGTGQTATWAGTLSADKRTLTLVRNSLEIAGGGSLELQLELRSDPENTRTGQVSNGELRTTAGTALPIGLSHPIAYTASYVAPQVSMSQTVSPRIEPGGSADIAIRYTNTATVQTLTGTVLELVAPSGTSFTSNAFRLTQDTYPTGWNLTGTLSADKRKLTISLPQHQLAAGGWGHLVVSLTSAADNTRTGQVTDGKLTVTGGLALPVGASTAIAYDSAYTAPKIEAVKLATPVLGATITDTRRPVFSGTGNPGADITVRAASGAVVATTTVGSDGKWSVPANFDLADGAYVGTVSQGVDGSTVRYEFTVKLPEVKVTPVTLESPALGAEIEPGKAVFRGKGHPGAQIAVRGTFGTLLGTATVGAGGDWSVESTISLAAGSYSGTVTQTFGSNTTTAAFSFNAARNTAVTLTSPAIGAIVAPGAPTFMGTGKPGAPVEVRGQYGTLLASATVDARGYWTAVSTISLVPGTYSGTVTQNADDKVTKTPFGFTIAK